MKKVLVVEDDIASRKLIVDAVRKLGHVSIQSSNGKRALDIVYDNPDIDLVITDLKMPEMDGKEMINILRGNEEYSTLPIIAVSGVVGIADVYDIMDMGSLEFLQKPLDIPLLNKCIIAKIGKGLGSALYKPI